MKLRYYIVPLELLQKLLDNDLINQSYDTALRINELEVVITLKSKIIDTPLLLKDYKLYTKEGILTELSKIIKSDEL